MWFCNVEGKDLRIKPSILTCCRIIPRKKSHCLTHRPVKEGGRHSSPRIPFTHKYAQYFAANGHRPVTDPWRPVASAPVKCSVFSLLLFEKAAYVYLQNMDSVRGRRLR